MVVPRVGGYAGAQSDRQPPTVAPHSTSRIGQSCAATRDLPGRDSPHASQTRNACSFTEPPAVLAAIGGRTFPGVAVAGPRVPILFPSFCFRTAQFDSNGGSSLCQNFNGPNRRLGERHRFERPSFGSLNFRKIIFRICPMSEPLLHRIDISAKAIIRKGRTFAEITIRSNEDSNI